MKSFLRFVRNLYSGPFQAALVFSFTLVAALTIAAGTRVISSTITSYLSTAMDERVEQDMLTAEMFYRRELEGIASAANQLALSNTIINSFAAAAAGDPQAAATINAKMITALTDPTMRGGRVGAVLDREGNFISGVKISRSTGQEDLQDGNWREFEIVESALHSGHLIYSTEVIPGSVLSGVGMGESARVPILETPKAARGLFDERERSAGLGLAAVSPVRGQDGVVGVVVVFHLFNNDFTLVDEIKTSTRVDTATIFFGDVRVSTNVMTADGERAVGTRVSEDVSQVVLEQGLNYVGTAFVVNENYITRYDPLYDHRDRIVGMLYVGTRQAAFLDFLNTFRKRVTLVAMVTILMTFLIATPVSRVITRPLKDLSTLAATSRKIAEGDFSARAPTTAGGEVGQLARSFNEMLDTLQKTQDQLIQSEKLASLGQLAAGVAHELNNPLATVLLFSEVLLREKALDRNHIPDLETIIRETRRCKSIVASLLDFARQQQVEAVEVDLNQLIRRVIDQEKKQTRYSRVTIRAELEDNLPVIQADGAQIQAVLVNLMSNAADAMPGGGQLTVRTYSDPPGMVSLEVGDEGEGISEENKQKLFTPFFTTKPPGKGTGLGLSIVYGIVKMHRGQIRVESASGEGTRIIVELPRELKIGQPPRKNFRPDWGENGVIG